MSNMFDAIGIAGSGLTVYKTWLDAVANNVANINTAKPTSQAAFQAQVVLAQPVTGGPDGVGQGVAVSGIGLSGNTTGRLVHDPGNPLADSQGMVRMPDISLGDQMTQMIIAQRAYQANAAIITRAQTAYQAALTLGKPGA